MGKPKKVGGAKRRARGSMSRSRSESGQPRSAVTLIYVHGIGNKPTEDVLKCQWDEALFGFKLGERSRLAYWVNRAFYPEAEVAACDAPDTTRDSHAAVGYSRRIASLRDPEDPDELLPANLSASQRKVLRALADTAMASSLREPTHPGRSYGAQVLPLPRPVREAITRRIVRAWLQDVNDYFYVSERRAIMRDSVLERLRSGGGPFVVIGHSQGSMIAYDVLASLSEGDVEVPLFVTIGSPLGITEVQDQVLRLTKQRRLAVPPAVGRWVNVSDPLDPVCADKRLRNDYGPTNGVHAEDLLRFNGDSPGDPHSATGYLRLSAVRNAVRESIDAALFQRIAPFTIAKDLVATVERGGSAQRHAVLIELRDLWETGESRSIDTVRSEVQDWIRAAVNNASPRPTTEELDLEALRAYVSANLTRSEIERMSAELHLTSVYRIFANQKKRALLTESINVLQCATAHRGYGACGQGITWAVLDSGIDDSHPHFREGEERSCVSRIFDCLAPGDVVERIGSIDVGGDRNGHGTHVAGIISGGMPELGISGIAPKAKLWSYKVLSDDGSGSDAKIIKALDHIYVQNENAPSLIIHGVNLSLGGDFDAEVFGCGDTPLCKQLRRLWRQGVVVVLAAGNDGYRELHQKTGVVGIHTSVSIGDPANLEEAIAVGSIHKSKPHLYGVSYFSSRGPTADGRRKPDVVAPGEKIVSCRAQPGSKAKTLRDLYVASSGTSMAAPHVSGVIACFLSVRPEFIGYPDKVKQLLLATSTDLCRDAMHQGAGMPNLVKMLLET